MNKFRSIIDKILTLMRFLFEALKALEGFIPALQTIYDFMEQNQNLSDDELALEMAKRFPIQNLHNSIDLFIYRQVVRFLRSDS